MTDTNPYIQTETYFNIVLEDSKFHCRCCDNPLNIPMLADDGHIYNQSCAESKKYRTRNCYFFNNLLDLYRDSKPLRINLRSIECPIDAQLLTNPRVAEDGFVYNEKAIKEWFRQSDRKLSPNTGLGIGTTLIQCHVLNEVLGFYHSTHIAVQEQKRSVSNRNSIANESHNCFGYHCDSPHGCNCAIL